MTCTDSGDNASRCAIREPQNADCSDIDTEVMVFQARSRTCSCIKHCGSCARAKACVVSLDDVLIVVT